MIVKRLYDLDEFCQLLEPGIGLFASKQWLNVYGEALHLMGIYRDDNQIIGGFYYFETKKLGFTIIKLPPYTPHCGLYFNIKGTNTAAVNGAKKEVMTAVCNYIKSQECLLSILAFPSSVVDMQSFIWSDFKVIPNYTYRISLNCSFDQIRANFDSKNRNAINKSIRDGVLVKSSSMSKNEEFVFFDRALRDAGANVYSNILSGIFNQFSNEANSFCLVASHGDKKLGMVFCVFDKEVCYYLLAGLDKQSGYQGVNNFLVQESIKKAMSLGCRIFDFEGSMIKGVERFFRSFGAELHPYYTTNRAWFPLELVLKKLRRWQF
jgi:lipid II:glycine glycyltransferase (peptidoglycan interpeptide bridge formation enzyme)